jgi:hypothetical protein
MVIAMVLNSHHAGRGCRWLMMIFSSGLLGLISCCLSPADVPGNVFQPPEGSGDFPEFSLPPLSGNNGSIGSEVPARPKADVPASAGARKSKSDRTGETPRARNPGSFRLPSANEALPPIDRPVRSPFDERDERVRDLDPSALSPVDPGTMPDPAPASEIESTDSWRPDWTNQPLSVADIGIGESWPFQHGRPNLSDDEEVAYIHFLRSVMYRKRRAAQMLPEDTDFVNAWETAFYRFEDIRRRAWKNGAVRLQSRMTIPADPFAGAGENGAGSEGSLFATTAPTVYSLSLDMQIHPVEFVGRPVVLYGLFKPSGPVVLTPRDVLQGEPTEFRMQRGFLRNMADTQDIALVDAVSYLGPDVQTQPSAAWPEPGKGEVMPVLVKGWFVKLWGQRPLIFSETIRRLSSRPYDELIRQHVNSRQQVTAAESWLYYETLRQLQITSGRMQAAIARQEQDQRAAELLTEIRGKARSDESDQVIAGSGTTETAGSRKAVADVAAQKLRIRRQLAQREAWFQSWLDKPEGFPAVLDVLENGSYWQGRLLTVRGHVRRVTSFSGDATLFGGQTLHELWLYPDNAQGRPVVVVTPSLPAEFPTSAEVVDAVTVTGCCFKIYSYRPESGLTSREQTELPADDRIRRLMAGGGTLNRLAPLLLAGRVEWNPSPRQLLSLAEAGALPPGSSRVRAAQAQSSERYSETVLLGVAVAGLFAMMAVWGRVQRDRKQRNRLRSLLDERPDFRQTHSESCLTSLIESASEPIRG